MRVLVSGGAGFIGSHVTQKLLGEGHEVAVLDNCSSGERTRVPPEARFFDCDLRDDAAVRRVVAEFKPEAISHQAAQASVPSSVDDPAYDCAVNVLGTVQLLQAAQQQGCERFVFASTGGAIYGEVAEGETADESWQIQPRSPYALAKAAAESYLSYFARCGLQTHVLRYANVYGPGQTGSGEAGVVAIFFERALRGEALTVFGRERPGDGGCVRDYVYVDDVARANVDACTGKLPVSLLNIGTGIATTTASLATKIAEATRLREAQKDAPARRGDLRRSVLGSSHRAAHWYGSTTLEAGLRATHQALS